MSGLVFSCPHCSEAVQCDPQYAGQTLACPHCRGGIICPEPTPESPASDQSPVISEQEAAGGQESGVGNQESVSQEPTPEVSDQSSVISEQEEAPAPEATPSPTPDTETSSSPVTTRIKKPTTKLDKPKGAPVKSKPGETLITFDCPGCGEELEIPEGAIGDAVGCPDCGREVTNDVPKPKGTTGKKKIVVKKKGVTPMG